jgi:hypothetical protein
MEEWNDGRLLLLTITVLTHPASQVSSSSQHSLASGKLVLLGSIIPIFHYSSIPVFQYSNIPVFQYSNIPTFQGFIPSSD